jgi:hypothetical protein
MPTWFCLLFNLLVAILLSYGFMTRSVIVISSSVLVIFIELLSMIEAHVNVRDLLIEPMDSQAFEAGQMATIGLLAKSISKSFGVRFYAVPPQLASDRGGVQTPLASHGGRSTSFPDYMRREIAAALFYWTNDQIDGESAEVSVTEEPGAVSVNFKVGRRGIYNLPRIVSVSMFPFGLFRVWREFSPEGVFVAYPRPVGVGYQSSMVHNQNAASLVGLSPRPSQESEYLHHKLFSQGDSVRRMDWKASSRRGVKIVKVFSGEISGERRVLRWVDTQSPDQESKLSQLSLWIHEARRDHVPFSLEIPGATTMVASGERHKAHCLRLLAGFDLPAGRAGDT